MADMDEFSEKQEATAALVSLMADLALLQFQQRYLLQVQLTEAKRHVEACRPSHFSFQTEGERQRLAEAYRQLSDLQAQLVS